MKKIIHLSDLHFGTEQPHILEILQKEIAEIHPDIIVISGDLTQRARISQFQAAKNFIDQLACKYIICVPGNHDIALYNLIERFFIPFFKFKKFINSELSYTFSLDNIAIFGLNSVTPFKPMGGYVTKDQLKTVKNFFDPFSTDTIKIVVMHHNLIHSERHKIINDAENIINNFASCGVNLILSGHIHHPHVEQLKRDFLFHNMYVITAGTAISTRTAAPNSFNVIEITEQEFKFSVMEFDKTSFIKANEIVFKR